MTLCVSDFDYALPPGSIAQSPLDRRDESRLLVLSRAAGQVTHHVFSELPALLRAGDLLVLNDTRVIPAKFMCKRSTGGRIEGLFLREMSAGAWVVLLRNAGRCKVGERLSLQGSDAELELLENQGEGEWRVSVSPALDAVELLERAGTTPLPPYIRRANSAPDTGDRQRYQTVYAQRPGAVAAPTAGLHFTPSLLEQLSQRGVEQARVTLHVGMGTFLPVKAERLQDHVMHSEWYELSETSADKLNQALAAGRRIVAVGTTSVRVLETIAAANPQGERCLFRPGSGWTNIFIYPPYKFRAVDAMITNFHLPKSTLLMLVSAFCSPGDQAGLPMMLRAYREAIQAGYRFFSYGDAMLIE